MEMMKERDKREIDGYPHIYDRGNDDVVDVAETVGVKTGEVAYLSSGLARDSLPFSDC